MFIEQYSNTKPYPCQYGNVFESNDSFAYIGEMANMREILKLLMEKHGDDAYSLEDKCGVPQPTTHRFLSGKHGDPRSSTVRKWAKAYGVTEGQLRGNEPLTDTKPAIRDITEALETMGDADIQYVLDLCKRLSNPKDTFGDPDYYRSSYESNEEADKKRKENGQ